MPNHVSFMDIILTVVFTPLSKVAMVKMFIAAAVFKMPVVGTISKAMGHLTVPFKAVDSESKDFTLDKAAMKEQMALMEKHIADGGYGGWFPEGTVNPGDPHKVRQFRAGGLKIAVNHDVEIWCLANVGNSIFWPKRASLGGSPCKIGYKFIRICESSKDFTDKITLPHLKISEEVPPPVDSDDDEEEPKPTGFFGKAAEFFHEAEDEVEEAAHAVERKVENVVQGGKDLVEKVVHPETFKKELAKAKREYIANELQKQAQEAVNKFVKAGYRGA